MSGDFLYHKEKTKIVAMTGFEKVGDFLAEIGRKIGTEGPDVIIRRIYRRITSEQLFVGLEGEKCDFNKSCYRTKNVTLLTVITSKLEIIGNIVTKVVL